MRRINVAITLLAACGVTLNVTVNYMCWDQEHLVFKEGRQQCRTGLWLQGVSIFLSILSGILVTIYYLKRAQNRTYELGFTNKSAWYTFQNTSLKWKYALELFVLLLQPIPGLQGVIWGFGHKLVLTVMPLRTYLVLRCLRDYALVYRHRDKFLNDLTSDLRNDKEVRSRADRLINGSTVLKTYLYTHSVAFRVVTLIFLIVLCSYAMYIVEREYWVPSGEVGDPRTYDKSFFMPNCPDETGACWSAREVDMGNGQATLVRYVKSEFSQLRDCIYFVIVTATTLGYGDMTPSSWQGKAIACVTVLLGVMLSHITVGVFANRLQPSVFETKVIQWTNEARLARQRKQLLTRILQTTLRARIRASRKERKEMKRQSLERSQSPSASHSPDPDEESEVDYISASRSRVGSQVVRSQTLYFFQLFSLTRQPMKRLNHHDYKRLEVEAEAYTDTANPAAFWLAQEEERQRQRIKRAERASTTVTRPNLRFPLSTPPLMSSAVDEQSPSIDPVFLPQSQVDESATLQEEVTHIRAQVGQLLSRLDQVLTKLDD